jgi:hypothetical protein
LLNLSAASPKKTRTRDLRLTGSVGVPAYEVRRAWLAKTVDCVLNGNAQETPSQGWKTFLRNHEGIASIGLFVVRKDSCGIPGSYATPEAVVDPNHPNHAEAQRFSPKFLLNDTVAHAEPAAAAEQKPAA